MSSQKRRLVFGPIRSNHPRKSASWKPKALSGTLCRSKSTRPPSGKRSMMLDLWINRAQNVTRKRRRKTKMGVQCAANKNGSCFSRAAPAQSFFANLGPPHSWALSAEYPRAAHSLLGQRFLYINRSPPHKRGILWSDDRSVVIFLERLLQGTTKKRIT